MLTKFTKYGESFDSEFKFDYFSISCALYTVQCTCPPIQLLLTRFRPNFKGRVKARSRQGQGKVKARSRQGQGKFKARSREGHGKFLAMSRRGPDKVKARSRRGQVKLERQGQQQ